MGRAEIAGITEGRQRQDDYAQRAGGAFRAPNPEQAMSSSRSRPSIPAMPEARIRTVSAAQCMALRLRVAKTRLRRY